MMILFYSLAIILLILFPSDTARTAYHALQLWGESIVPVLFPYMVFSRLLCSKLNNLRLPAFPVVAILGLLGGSPSGAASVSANADKLSQRKTLILCTLTGTVSPMFILGTLQPWVQHPLLCRRLLWCHWLSALLSSWLIFLFSKGYLPSIVKTSDKNAVSFDPIMQSVDAVLQVGGCVILYSVLAGMLGRILHSFSFLPSLFHAILEISGGIHAICQSNIAISTKSILLSAVLGFSGFSILSQNHAILRPIGISMRLLILFALLRALLSASLMLMMNLLLPII